MAEPADDATERVIDVPGAGHLGGVSFNADGSRFALTETLTQGSGARRGVEEVARRINAVHQEVVLCRHLSVAANMFLGEENVRYGILQQRGAKFDALGATIDGEPGLWNQAHSSSAAAGSSVSTRVSSRRKEPTGSGARGRHAGSGRQNGAVSAKTE